MRDLVVALASAAIVVLVLYCLFRTMQLRNERNALRGYVDMLATMRPYDEDTPGYNDTRRFGGTTVQVFGPTGESPFGLKSGGEGMMIEVVCWPRSFTVQDIAGIFVDSDVVVRGERGTSRVLLDAPGNEQQAMNLVVRLLAAAVRDR